MAERRRTILEVTMPDDWVEKQFKRRQRARILKSDIKAMRHAIKADGLTAHIPPDLVVKFQHLDIANVILRWVLRPHVVDQREIIG